MFGTSANSVPPQDDSVGSGAPCSDPQKWDTLGTPELDTLEKRVGTHG